MTVANSCPFCDLIDRKVDSLYDAAQVAKPDFQLIAPVGMLMPGYLLLIPSKHITSFAQYEPEALRSIHAWLTEQFADWSNLFGRYFVFEHGSDNVLFCNAGGCIDHAHLHLIPADTDAGDHIQAQLDWQKIERFEDLTKLRGTPYLYFGRGEHHYVVPNPQVRSQWVRRMVAEVRKIEIWDWALTEKSDEHLFRTFWTLREFPGGYRACFNSQNQIAYKLYKGPLSPPNGNGRIILRW